MALRQRLATGAVWVGLSRAGVNVAGVVSMIVLARLLTPSDFGLVAIATTVLAVVSSLTELSLSSALVHHDDPDEEHYHTAFTLTFLRAVVVAAVIILLAFPVAAVYDDERLTEVLIALGLTTAVTGAANPKLALMLRQLVFWQDFLLNIARRLASLVVSIAVAVIYESYWALVIGMMIGEIAYVGLSYAIRPFLPRLSFGHAREMLGFAVWLSLGQAVNAINWRFDHLLVGYVLGKADLGAYSVGDRLASLPSREATAPLAQVLFPGLATIRSDPGMLRRGFVRAQNVMLFFALPLGCGLGLVADPLVVVAMGPEWAAAALVVQLLAPVIALQTLGSVVEPLALALGETRRLFLRDSLNLAIRLPIVSAGLLLGGLPGLLLARCATGLIAILLNMLLVRSLIGLGLVSQIAANTRTFASTAVMTGAVLLAGALAERLGASPLAGVSVEIFVGGLAYALAALALWALAGSPDGPEKEVRIMLGRLMGRAPRPGAEVGQ